MQKMHTQNATNDISVLTDQLPGRRGSDIVLVRSFDNNGYPRCYRDILESVRGLGSTVLLRTPQVSIACLRSRNLCLPAQCVTRWYPRGGGGGAVYTFSHLFRERRRGVTCFSPATYTMLRSMIGL
jgi:hypothetical protein